MAIRIQSINPKPRDPVVEDIAGAFDDEFGQRGWAGAMIRDMAEYPPWRPWKRPPRTGPRRGGRRTGDLGRGWRLATQHRGRLYEVANDVRYTVFVQGPLRGAKGQRQARHMRERGWQSVSDIARHNTRVYSQRLTRILAGQRA